jgi:hypothetical protein
MLEVFRYQAADGTEPVTDWLQSLRDKQAQAKLRIRLKRLEAGSSATVNRSATACWNCGSTWARAIAFTLGAMGSVS